MSLNVALNTALSGLFANQRAVAATSENIANVNTPDFARREAQFFTDAIPNQFSGVDVEIARAATDRFLQSAVFQGAADAAGAEVIADALARIEASLGAPGDNISFSNALDDAFASLTSLSANPSSIAARADAIAALDAAFAAFARTQDAIALESDAALSQLSASADRVNALLEEVFRLNATAPDSPGAADLINARLTELSSFIDIAVTRADDGRVTVSTQSGTLLANSASFAAIGVEAGPPTSVTVASVDGASGVAGAAAPAAAGDIGAGTLRGLLDLRNTTLTALADDVQATAQGVADSLNAAYAQNSIVGATAPTTDALIVADAAGRFSVNAVLRDDPARLAIARPSAGNAGGANDGLGAAALADIGVSPATAAAAETVARIGSAARNAQLAAETNSALATELSTRASAESGVNLDEELSNLIVFQRAYNANARVIAAVDELWQSLLSLI
ncbi:MAG: flagellar hook-associated protein FlgK [Pseudomonadota bacterium]